MNKITKSFEYKVTVVKAFKPHVCAVSGEPINKGDLYIHIAVYDGLATKVSPNGGEYHPTDTYRVTRQVFANYNIYDILTKILGRPNLLTISQPIQPKLKEVGELLQRAASIIGDICE